MDNEQTIQLFMEARQHIFENITGKVEVFMTRMWDPLMKHIIIRETCDIIQRELCMIIPDLDSKYYPQVKFRIFPEDYQIEAGVQCYLNTESNLTFLGTSDIGDSAFDFYMRDSWDPRFDHVYIARYGHSEDCKYTGAKTAEAEYMMGMVTPLSVAYGMAMEDGFIK